MILSQQDGVFLGEEHKDKMTWTTSDFGNVHFQVAFFLP